MAVRLDLPTEAIAELVAAARHKDNIIPSTEAAGKLSPQVGISGVARLLSEQLGTDRNELVSLFSTVLNFYQTKVRLKCHFSITRW